MTVSANFPHPEARSISNMTYGNLSNWTDNFSFLGRVSMEMELKVKAPFLAHSPKMEVLVAGVSFLWAEVKMGRQEEDSTLLR